MDGGGEQSESESRNQPPWIPVTPINPNLPGKMQFQSSRSPAGDIGDEESVNSAEICKPIVDLIDSWKDYSFRELLMKAEAGTMPSAPTPARNENNGCRDGGATENRRVHYGVSVPHQRLYDLNLTPENNFGTSLGTSIPKFAPVTPDKSVRTDNLDASDTTHQATEKENCTTLENINEMDNDNDGPMPSRELQENQNSENVDGRAIDLNNTPQQKQRRKKHRPKVITEGKPRTPKPVTPKPADPKENPTGKRKYVRKNAKEKASETPAEVGGSKTVTPRKRSCRKALNFEDIKEEYEDSRCSSFNVNSKSQVHRLCTGSVSKVTVQLCRGIEEVTAGKTQAQNTYESAAQGLLDRERQPCPMSPNDSYSSTVINQTERKDQAKDYKGNDSHAVKQANAGSINMNGIYYNSVQAYHLISWQNNTKKRTEKGLNNVASSATFFDAENYIGGKVTANDGNKVLEAFGQTRKGFQDDWQTNGTIIIDLSPKSTKKRSRSATRARDLVSLKRMVQFYPTEQPKSCIDALMAQAGATFARKRRTKKRYSPAFQYPALYSDQQSNSRFSGVLQEVASTKTLSVDDIDRQLKCLDINRETSSFVCQDINAIVPFARRYQEHNALILYRSDGTMVPFENTKKPRPRPKVELDEETTRVWKLLLENINSEGIDGTDEDKAKWWEEERKVFCGRADSFIARMHLVQGDRRFSKWKGSVLDSVVGVFLTQNVSDHLSSSAFMSLAARFSLKSRNHGKASLESDELEVCTSENTLNQPVCNSSFVPRDAEDKEIIGINKQETYASYSVENYMEWEGKETDGLISLQQCVDSSTSQTCDKTGSCSESNSDVEDLANRNKPDGLEESTSLLENLHTDESSMLQEVNHGSGETSSDVKLKNDCIESKATEHDDNREDMDKADPKTSFESSMEPASDHHLCEIVSAEVSVIESFEIFREENQSSDVSQNKTETSACDQSSITVEFLSQNTIQNQMTAILQEAPSCSKAPCTNIQADENTLSEPQNRLVENSKHFEALIEEKHSVLPENLPNHSDKTQVVVKDTTELDIKECGHLLSKECSEIDATTPKPTSRRARKDTKSDQDWDKLRKQAEAKGKRERKANTMDSLDWEAVRCANVDEIANTIKERGMNNKLAERIKDFLNRLVREHGSTDLEWLRDVPPDQAKEYLLSIRGLGLKSVECVRLLTLHHLAFPVDTNVGRIAVRLGWVPLQPLPESLQLHLLELYPVLESIQKYLWPRLCKLDQRTLYELHYQMITFGKVFCTKSKPNCNACPMRGECRHFASAFASARLALPGPEEKSIVIATEKEKENINHVGINERAPLPLPHATGQSKQDQHLLASHQSEATAGTSYCEPVIEEPATPEPECTIGDIEDSLCEDTDEIPTIKLNIEAFNQNVQNYMQQNMELQDGDMSKALVAIGPEAASIPMPKLKNVSRLRTEHQVYELPDSHPLLEMLQMEKREPDDPSPYLLAIWTPGETVNSIEPPAKRCCAQGLDKLCNDEECFSCNSIREANSQTVRGTLLIPCRTAMRGSFPLNGTYFQVNEVFADHDSSLNPIDVPRALIWNLQRRTVYFGTSIPTIFKGLTTQGIQHCFWRGYVCVRGFDQKSRAPRPLIARLHFPASKGKRTRDPRNDD